MDANDDAISVRVISDTKGILQIKREWNVLVGNSCRNPFLLSEFVKEFIESRQKGWAPLVLVVSFKNAIIGIVPLMIRQKFGVRSVRIPNPPFYSEFIIEEQYREVCIESIVDFLFKTLKCKFADFTLPSDSSNFGSLLSQCQARRIHFKTLPEMGRRIIHLRCTWTEFEAEQGKRFRNEMKRIERNLTKVGPWKIVCADGNESPEAIKKIFAVERNSWKEKWRAQRDESTDEILKIDLRALRQLSKEPKFKWNIWSLELSGKTIAYQLSIEFKGVVFFAKTAYDEQYKKLYPGIAIQNAAIKEQFNKQQNKYIDLLSDFPYQKTWTNECIPRNRIKLANGILPITIQFTLENKIIGKILLRMF
jgi:CelD/BcsL family acetyltransferase involved in cellulose biosynthesis